MIEILMSLGKTRGPLVRPNSNAGQWKTVCGSLGILLWALSSSASASLFGSNLIVNGNAESDTGSASGYDVIRPITGWAATSNVTVVKYDAPGGFPTSIDPGPSERGFNFFAGGPGNSFSTLQQAIDISSIASQVDGGDVRYVLDGFLGGYFNQDDNVKVTVSFLDSSSGTLATGQLGPVLASDRSNATGLVYRRTDGLVPVGTRTIDVLLEFTRSAGVYNDGYADNLSFVLNNNSSAIPEPASAWPFGILLFCWLFYRGRNGFCWWSCKHRNQAVRA